MKWRNLIIVALRSIARNKLRSLLTMLGIIIGVGAVIVMVAVGYGARSRIREQIQNLGTNMIVITPGNWRTMVNGVVTDYQAIRDWPTASGSFFGPEPTCAGRAASPSSAAR
jgi:ABC-type lipoprotein release transport system permease subunit